MAMIPLQSFQAIGSLALSIPTRQDSKTNEFMVLWNDVQHAFKNADYIRHHATVIPFMIDESFEYLRPLRIRHHPDVVLEVVLKDSDTASIAASDITFGTVMTQERSILPVRQSDSKPIESVDTRATKDHSWEKAALGVGIVVGTAVGAPIVVTGGAAAALGIGVGAILASLIRSTVGGAAAAGGVAAAMTPDKEDKNRR
ncbi:hypothetical protein BGZ65_000591 [Modicella reniformis]|uniref:Uncharacterized protein n=1 Tax=Modicella reniformis TaxID=1440133 RepID=A0A9P6MBT9_9FUNG|nr:hypothetical protein BGZ65_000591 [Modicella reniformis]